MRLIRHGDRGAHVLDVQARLGSLGYDIPADERLGSFADGTLRAVSGFQQQRGLIVDGIVGEDSWRELVEASWRLGDRVLYLRAPNLRGDDVRELQDRLATMGFDPWRTDGMFGPRTADAVREFQHNYGLNPDGIVGEGTVRALAGLPKMAGDVPVASVRERAALEPRPGGIAGMRIVIDPGHGPDDPGHTGPTGAREADLAFTLAVRVQRALASAAAEVFLSRRADASPPERERAALANALDADLFLSLHLGGGEPSARGCAAFYFGHERFRSQAGERLAELMVEEVCAALGTQELRAHAKTYPVLRETRMTAIVLEPGYITNAEEERLLTEHGTQARLVYAIATAVARFAGAHAAA